MKVEITTLEQLRLVRGFKYKYFNGKIGMSRKTYHNIINGKRTATERMIKSFSKIFEASEKDIKELLKNTLLLCKKEYTDEA